MAVSFPPILADISLAMIPQWDWIALSALAALAGYQQFRVHRIRVQAKQHEELFQIVTENAADMIALVDVKGHRLYNSPAYRRILGYTAAELGETSAFDQIHPDDRLKVLEAAREARSTGVGKKLEYRIQHKNGQWLVLESIAGTIRDEKGEVAKLVIVNRDITERKRAEEQAEHNSFHDGLTGLPNRRLFLDRLQHLFERAKRNPEQQYAVLFVDLDGFKVFNETMGPAVGDQVIIQVGRRLDACLRNEDKVSRSPDEAMARNGILSRLGSDEFTILLENINDPSHAMRAAQRVLFAIAKPFHVGDQEIRTPASVGIALSSSLHENAEQLLQDADRAMRRAKALGGSRCEIIDEAMHTRATNRLKLETELRQAIAQNQFRLHYQPIVQLGSRQIIGLEALLRWQHPEQGLISPYKFIAAAEDRGPLVAAGSWVIREACQQLQRWVTQIPAMQSIYVSVNVSAKQLTDARFVSDLENMLREAETAPTRLHLEVTESVADFDPAATTEVLTQLKKLGIGVTLDDFGTGNSSLSRLRQMTGIEALKIDRSLIGGMLMDRGTLETVEVIILLAHKLKLKVIAEGIEFMKQCDQLQALECDLGQGFLFSQPVDAKKAELILRERNTVRHASIAGA
jgi:diguanylate cyclase (GGDEF)-like protein/PAS domain S-box-containing protein